jgi:flavin reductase (DIM6/NTAB) family NADH-FMN oxidoreductase RutF
LAVDLDQFRQGMRRLVASVCIVTTGNSDGPTAGMTATAVCSVSADPPTLLICVNRASGSYAAILAAGVFAVNVLGIEDRELANRFAGRLSTAQKYGAGIWHIADGAPVLETALASFACRVSQHIEVGSHGILFGRINTLQLRAGDAQPLLYAHGAYGGFTGYRAARASTLLWLPEWGGEPLAGWEDEAP